MTWRLLPLLASRLLRTCASYRTRAAAASSLFVRNAALSLHCCASPRRAALAVEEDSLHSVQTKHIVTPAFLQPFAHLLSMATYRSVGIYAAPRGI